MFKSLRSLLESGIATPKGLWQLNRSFRKYGKNLLGVVAYANAIEGAKIAVSDGEIEKTYPELLDFTLQLKQNLFQKGIFGYGKRVALIGRNNIDLIGQIIALSSLGVDVFLINYEHSTEQIQEIIEHRKMDVVICSEILKQDLNVDVKLFCFQELQSEISEMSAPKFKAGNLTVLTGGSTGKPKLASRKSSISSVLAPFLALLNEMKLHQNKSVIISVPFCHGYGLASLIVSLALRKSIYTQEKFNADSTSKLIEQHQIEVAIFVPTMLQRMLKEDAKGLSVLHKILSGGAAISENLYQSFPEELKQKVFNLYGTSEAGFCVIGTPKILEGNPNSIGKPIKGVRLKIIDEHQNELKIGAIGELAIASKWTAGKLKSIVPTGDLASIDQNGLIYLKGRKDDLIITGGENVYPKDIEQVLEQHPKVEFCKITSVPSSEFGQEIVGLVQIPNPTENSEEEILTWLKPKLARFQQPKKLIIQSDFPFTDAGKLRKSDLNMMIQKIKLNEKG